MSNDTIDILISVQHERLRQEQLKAAGKFTKTCADNMPNAERLVVLAEEFGEVAREVCESLEGKPTPNLRTELIQVAAVCVAWVEGLDRDTVRIPGPESDE